MKHRHQTPSVTLRNVVRQIAELDPAAPDFALRFKNLQDSAKAALQEAIYAAPGNPRIENARAIAAASRRQKAELLRAQMAPLLAELRQEGCQTYQELATALNKRNVKPPRAAEWTASTVHALENPRPQKS